MNFYKKTPTSWLFAAKERPDRAAGRAAMKSGATDATTKPDTKTYLSIRDQVGIRSNILGLKTARPVTKPAGPAEDCRLSRTGNRSNVF